MLTLICITIISALISAFAVLFIDYSGARCAIVENCKSRFISKLFSCDFCLSFWVNVAACTIFAIIAGDNLVFILPVLSTPITRHLL